MAPASKFLLSDMATLSLLDSRDELGLRPLSGEVPQPELLPLAEPFCSVWFFLFFSILAGAAPGGSTAGSGPGSPLPRPFFGLEKKQETEAEEKSCVHARKTV